MHSPQQHYARIVKEEAAKLGFQFCGISKAAFLEEEAPRLEQWLRNGHHGEMRWMENHYDLRLDPSKLVPGAKSVVSLLYNYYTDKTQRDPEAPKVSTYAFGRDYHKVIKKKLKELLKNLTEKIGEINGRAFVDSAPVMERTWAAKSGLGWQGKHTLLINKGYGSYHFLSELIVDLDLEPDGPVKDYCGTCTACIDACPTQAIKPYQLEAEKCISYLTIELKDNLPGEYKNKLANWAFGCDVCQQVCPWNRFAKNHHEPEFEPSQDFLNMPKREWHEMTEEVFLKVFENTPLKRAGYKGLMKNIQASEESEEH